jgi:hypothetical protein
MMRSNFERTCASELMLMGVSFEYESIEMEFHSRVRSGTCNECGGTDVVKIRWYTPDFVLEDKKIIIEAKGKFTAENRTKMLDVIRDHPEWDIRMWFMYDNKLAKKSKIRYSDWCKKHGITYHCGKEAPPWADLGGN